MSLQELHIRALEDQVLNLTRDCHYLMSLLNSTDDIDWDNWEQGRRIKEDLERSKDFFAAMRRRSEKIYGYDKDRETKQREREAAEMKRQRDENARQAQEYLKRREAERSGVNTFANVQKQKGMNYTLGDYINDIFKEFGTFRLFP